MEFLIKWGYWGMLIAAFLAGSILPGNSEVVMSGLLAVGLNKWHLLTVAMIGNILGGASCYWIGYMGKMDWLWKYSLMKPERVEKMHRYLEGKGAWFSVFVFVPFFGDLMIVVFGLLRSNFWIVMIGTTIGKFIKYFLWMWLTIGVIDLVV